jgi:hypothetical protein
MAWALLGKQQVPRPRLTRVRNGRNFRVIGVREAGSSAGSII